MFYCYAFRYEMGLLDESERFKPTGIKTGSDEHIIMEEEDLLPVDTLIHLCDDSFLNTDDGTRSFALMTRRPLTMQMHPVALRIGANVILRGTLEPLGEAGRLDLTTGQVETLRAFQALTFGVISVKQYQIRSLQDVPRQPEEDGDSADDAEQRLAPSATLIPEDKQSLFFVGLTMKSGASALLDPSDHVATLEKYKRFIGRVGERLGAHLKTTTEHPVPSTTWELDWTLMERALQQDAWLNLHAYLSSLEAFASEHAPEIEALGPTPVFDYPNDPSRAPLSVTLAVFALRRLVLYAPYNGLYYRAKVLEDDLTAGSAFENTSVPDAHTYAEYVQQRYGLPVQHMDYPLVRVKRVENFASLGNWLQTTSRGAQSGQRRHRLGRYEQSRSDLIPELIRIIPLPYAHVRMAMLIPRATYDIERQALIHDFYASKLPSVLTGPAPSLPPSAVLVDSMTGPTASLTYDFERLEILGDSFLKLVASIDVFLACPSSTNEGRLSSKRQELVCNATLYDIAVRLGIYRYARLTPFFAKLWCPPDLLRQFGPETVARFPYIPLLFDEGSQRWRVVWEADERAGKRSALHHLLPDGTLVDRGQAAGEHIVLVGAAKHQRHKSTPSNTPVLSRFGQPIPPKAMADLLEAIIGAVYKAGGYDAGMQVLRGLGMLSDTMDGYRDICPEEVLGAIRTAEPSNPRASAKIVVPEGLQKMSDVAPYAPPEEDYPYEEIEAILGYRFRSRRLLYVAMTHASVDVTFSNERLEWLGDAILDWAITEYYWEEFSDAKWMTPARITACRQAAVCNEAFSRIVVHAGGLHRFLRIDAPFLQLEIEQYVQAVMAVEDGQEAADPEGPLSALSWNTRYDLQPADASTVKARAEPGGSEKAPRLTVPPAPKALGDLFEGIAGAVFLDLGFDAPAFACIFLPLLRWYLDRHADPYDLPENPISDFWHDYLAAGVPPSAIEFRYCQSAEVQQRLLQQQGGAEAHAEKASTATCQILVRGRIVAEATAPTRVLARKFATRQAVIYIRSSGWRDFLS